jgi:hypothetical protein
MQLALPEIRDFFILSLKDILEGYFDLYGKDEMMWRKFVKLWRVLASPELRRKLDVVTFGS